MVHVVVVPLVGVEATGGVDAGAAQAFADFGQQGAGDAADVVEAVAVVLLQQLHDVGEVLLAGEVEVDLYYLAVGQRDGAPHAVDVQSFFVQAEVAEARLQDVGPVDGQGEERQGDDQSVGAASDARLPEAQAEGQEAEDGVPEEVERGTPVGDSGLCGGGCGWLGALDVVHGDALLHQVAYDGAGVVARVERQQSVCAVFQMEGQEAGAILVQPAVAFGHRGMSLHEAKAAQVLGGDASLGQEAAGAALMSFFHGCSSYKFWAIILVSSIPDS